MYNNNDNNDVYNNADDEGDVNNGEATDDINDNDGEVGDNDNIKRQKKEGKKKGDLRIKKGGEGGGETEMEFEEEREEGKRREGKALKRNGRCQSGGVKRNRRWAKGKERITE